MGLDMRTALLIPALILSLPAAAQDRGLTVGFGAALGSPAGRTDNRSNAEPLASYTGWVAPLEAWASYRFHPLLEVGALGALGPGLTLARCSNATNCSAQLNRVGLLMRGSLPLPEINARVFAAAGPGWEWLRHSDPSAGVDRAWSGPTFLNVQTGLVLGAERRFHVVPVLSGSVAQFRSFAASSGSRSASEAVEYPGLHFAFSIGLRIEAEVLGYAPPAQPVVRRRAGALYDEAVVLARSLPVLRRTAPASAARRAEALQAKVAEARGDLAAAPKEARIATESDGPLSLPAFYERLDGLDRQAREALGAVGR